VFNFDGDSIFGSINAFFIVELTNLQLGIIELTKVFRSPCNYGSINLKLFSHFRYYGGRRVEGPANPAKGNAMVSSVPKPIITVTEFTPGNTPDKVRARSSYVEMVGCAFGVS
jgi:hypothetical protein